MSTRSAAFSAEEPMGQKRRRREERAGRAAAPTSWGSRILQALQGRQVFQGVDPEMDPAAYNRLVKRRRKNRMAKASRKANRR